MMAMTFSPFGCWYPEYPIPSPLFGYGVGPVAMEHAQSELLLCREMPHARDERLPP
jgi:hypothetical protein